MRGHKRKPRYRSKSILIVRQDSLLFAPHRGFCCLWRLTRNTMISLYLSGQAPEEFHRIQSPKEVGELGALSNLYFTATSEAGTWSLQEIADWQREADLIPRKPIRLLTALGAELQTALKPNARKGNGDVMLRKE